VGAQPQTEQLNSDGRDYHQRPATTTPAPLGLQVAVTPERARLFGLDELVLKRVAHEL
jgi:hypothetical protein